MTDQVGLVGTQQHDRAGAQAVALADRDGAAGEGTACVHPIDRDLDRHVVDTGAREHGVHGLDRLVVVAGVRGHDRLSDQLTAEDDRVAEVHVGGAVAVGTDRLERERGEDPVDAHRRQRPSNLGGRRST